MKDSLKELIELGAENIKATHPADDPEKEGRKCFVQDMEEYYPYKFEYNPTDLDGENENVDGKVEFYKKDRLIDKVVVEVKKRHYAHDEICGMGGYFIREWERQKLLEEQKDRDCDYAWFYNRTVDGHSLIWDVEQIDFDRLRSGEREKPVNAWDSTDWTEKADFYYLPASEAKHHWIK